MVMGSEYIHHLCSLGCNSANAILTYCRVKRQGNVLEMVETGVETALDEVTEDLKDFVPSLGDAEGNGGE